MIHDDGQLALTAPAPRTDLGPELRALGWSGLALPELELFGERVTPVVRVDAEVDSRRRAAGWGPVLDRAEIAMWSWPEAGAAAPLPAVAVEGVLATSPRWMPGVRRVARLRGFGATAVVCDSARAPSGPTARAAGSLGVGLVHRAPGGVALVGRGRSGPAPTARPTSVSRWVRELLYQHYLRSG